MQISLIIIGVISLVVVAGIAFLYGYQNQEMTDKQKNLILLIVGTVIFLSFLATTFKHRTLSFSSSYSTDGTLDVKKVFFGGGCKFNPEPKYEASFEISEDNLRQMEKRNHVSLYDVEDRSDVQNEFLKDYQEMIVFLSKKDEGASFYLSKLAGKICSKKKKAIIYLKLDREVKNQHYFLRLIGVDSFQQLQRNYCYFSDVGITVNRYDVQYTLKQSESRVGPYLIIDNFQHLLGTLAEPSHHHPFASQLEEQSADRNEENYDESNYRYRRYTGRKLVFEKILKELVNNCRINIILNTEKEEAIQQLFQLWRESQLTEPKDSKGQILSSFPFEYHRWEGLKQYDLFKIISNIFPTSDSHLSKMLEINKQDFYTFKDLFSIVQELSKQSNKGQKYENIREGAFVKEWDLKYSVASYYGLGRPYKYLKTSENRKISQLKQKIEYGHLLKLQDLGLIEIRRGVVFLK